MEIQNVSEYIAYTNRYNGVSPVTSFGMINLADRKNPDMKTYGCDYASKNCCEGPPPMCNHSHKYNLAKPDAGGSTCPETEGLAETEYVSLACALNWAASAIGIGPHAPHAMHAGCLCRADLVCCFRVSRPFSLRSSTRST